MNVSQFKATLDEINQSSWGFGNEILYLMARDPNDLKDEKKLAGSIWLIGRAYAASPQRRSYGTTDAEDEYKKIFGDKVEKRPIWPVRTQNDGREGFFDEIAKEICKKIPPKMSNNVYKYDGSKEDYEMLTQAISEVLKFNITLSEALEAFDGVPKDNKFNGNNVYCSNHISFCSKFLHFYFPNSVFIIDNFAREGGKLLFSGDGKKCYFDISQENQFFEEDVYQLFNKNKAKEIYKNINVDSIKDDYKKRTRSKQKTKDDDSTVKDYIEHCIRSYLLGCFIKNEAKINPINQIQNSIMPQVESMPRLTDAIFLNIKEYKQGEIDKQNRIKKFYKITY